MATATPSTSTPKQPTLFAFVKSGVGNIGGKAGEALEKVGLRKSPTPSPPKETPVKMSDVEKEAAAAGPLNDITNISGVKRTSSGKLSHFPGRESLITMNSRLEKLQIQKKKHHQGLLLQERGVSLLQRMMSLRR